jgi:putative PIN family toxin of toxin-antitoxin system
VKRVVADSNIFISALLLGGKPLELIELARAGQIELAITEDILDEIARVLSTKFRVSAEDARDMRDEISGFTKLIAATEALDVVKADPTDNKVLECAAAAGSQSLLNELRGVLEKKFSQRAIDVRAALQLFAETFTLVKPDTLDPPVCRDRDDDVVLATALAGDCAAIITGDQDLLILNPFRGIQVLMPSAFWKWEAER